uniref:Uncharacterized protein n=1 Tax=Rhizophora mucronata TaxID=61149 RepID=A0A2P2QTT4_RHIMU
MVESLLLGHIMFIYQLPLPSKQKTSAIKYSGYMSPWFSYCSI